MSNTSPVEIRLIKYWTKHGGFAHSESVSYRVEVWNNELAIHENVSTQYVYAHAHNKQLAEQWAKLLNAPIVPYTEKRRYETVMERG